MLLCRVVCMAALPSPHVHDVFQLLHNSVPVHGRDYLSLIQLDDEYEEFIHLIKGHWGMVGEWRPKSAHCCECVPLSHCQSRYSLLCPIVQTLS